MGGNTKAFQALVDIVARLRAPDGCPWDREQTNQSAAPYLLEEAFEAAEAIDHNDPKMLCEELGDLLLQVVFQTQMIADTSGAFTIEDVAQSINDKLIRRHPHVFADTTVSDATEVLANWETIKRAEKPERVSMLDGVPKGLPALLRALRVGQKASRVNFDWPNVAQVVAKVDEEMAEFHDARANGTPDDCEREFGDVLFALVQVARHLNIDPEGALRRTVERFTGRFQCMEQSLQRDEKDASALSLDEWEQLWHKAKEAS